MIFFQNICCTTGSGRSTITAVDLRFENGFALLPVQWATLQEEHRRGGNDARSPCPQILISLGELHGEGRAGSDCIARATFANREISFLPLAKRELRPRHRIPPSRGPDEIHQVARPQSQTLDSESEMPSEVAESFRHRPNPIGLYRHLSCAPGLA